jgi:hypothetical protein
MKYRIDKKEKKLALGLSPDVSLLTAHQLRDAARSKMRVGSLPPLTKKSRNRKRKTDRHSARSP